MKRKANPSRRAKPKQRTWWLLDYNVLSPPLLCIDEAAARRARLMHDGGTVREVRLVPLRGKGKKK